MVQPNNSKRGFTALQVISFIDKVLTSTLQVDLLSYRSYSGSAMCIQVEKEVVGKICDKESFAKADNDALL